MNEYAVYKGDELLCVGTSHEIAEHMGWQVKTVYWYTTPQYRRRVARRKKAENYITVVRLED